MLYNKTIFFEKCVYFIAFTHHFLIYRGAWATCCTTTDCNSEPITRSVPETSADPETCADPEISADPEASADPEISAGSKLATPLSSLISFIVAFFI